MSAMTGGSNGIREELIPLRNVNSQKDVDDYKPLYSEVSCLKQTPDFIGSVANLSNAAIGAGVLAFPYAFSVTGYILGPILACFFGVVMWFALWVLGRAAAIHGCSSYQEAVKMVLGHTWERVMEVCMYLYLFGSCTAYMNIIGDQISPLLLNWHVHTGILEHREAIITLFTLVVITPLCFLKRIEYLGPTSTLAVISIVYLSAMLMYKMYTTELAMDFVPFKWTTGIFEAVPIICFALQCHLVYIPQFHGMRYPSETKMAWVGVATMIVCCGLYIPAGLAGYLLLGNNTPGDILVPFGEAIDITIGRLCITATAVVSYPLLQFIARSAIDDFFFGGRKHSNVRWTLETLGFIAATLLLSLAVPKIKNVLGFTGATTAVTQALIIPGLLLRKLKPNDFWTGQVAGVVLATFGIAMGILSTVVVAMNVSKSG